MFKQIIKRRRLPGKIFKDCALYCLSHKNGIELVRGLGCFDSVRRPTLHCDYRDPRLQSLYALNACIILYTHLFVKTTLITFE